MLSWATPLLNIDICQNLDGLATSAQSYTIPFTFSATGIEFVFFFFDTFCLAGASPLCYSTHLKQFTL